MDFDQKERTRSTAAKVSDEEILANPYRMCEVDLGDWNDSPVSVGLIDRGLLPEAAVQQAPSPGTLEGGLANSAERLRAALVAVLRGSFGERRRASERFRGAATRRLAGPCSPLRNRFGLAEYENCATARWRPSRLVEITGTGAISTAALRLTELKGREDRLPLRSWASNAGKPAAPA